MGRVKGSGYVASMYLCYSFVAVCYPNVTRMYQHVSACYSYVTRIYPCGILVKIVSKTIPILSASAGP